MKLNKFGRMYVLGKALDKDFRRYNLRFEVVYFPWMAGFTKSKREFMSKLAIKMRKLRPLTVGILHYNWFNFAPN